ncbi:MAG: hypothetical protein ACXABO_06685 [Promethearchaeota archaeon]|jgi:hypothetical protein
MNPWKVSLKFSDGSDKTLELFDAKTYFDGYLKIKRSFFDALIKSIKMTKKYLTNKAIETVIGPDEMDWTLNPWMLIIIRDNEKNMPFWLFIKREVDLTGELVAIGPKQFAEYNDKNSYEAKREIKRLMNYIIVYLNKFNCVIFLPKFLA